MPEASQFFHLYIDYKLGALPTSVTLVSLNIDIQREKLPQYPAIEGYIDALIDEKKIDFHHEFIYPRLINEHGFRYAARQAIEQAVPSLILKSGKTPEAIVMLKHLPGSHYYKNVPVNERTSGITIARWIGWFMRKYDVDLCWHDFHPEYGWKYNNGVMNRQQALACLEHGIIPAYHYVEALKRVPSLWVREIELGNIQYMYGTNYLAHPPFWWTEMFGARRKIKKYTFFKFMSPREKKWALTVIQSRMPGIFRYGFLYKHKPI